MPRESGLQRRGALTRNKEQGAGRFAPFIDSITAWLPCVDLAVLNPSSRMHGLCQMLSWHAQGLDGRSLSMSLSPSVPDPSFQGKSEGNGRKEGKGSIAPGSNVTNDMGPINKRPSSQSRRATTNHPS